MMHVYPTRNIKVHDATVIEITAAVNPNPLTSLSSNLFLAGRPPLNLTLFVRIDYVT